MDLEQIRTNVLQASIDGQFHTGYKLDPIELSKRCLILCKFAQDGGEYSLHIPCASSKDAATKGTQYRRIKNLLLEQPWFQHCHQLRSDVINVSFAANLTSLRLNKRGATEKNPSVGISPSLVEVDCSVNKELVEAFLVVFKCQALPTSVQVRLNVANMPTLDLKILHEALKPIAQERKITLLDINKTFYISISV